MKRILALILTVIMLILSQGSVMAASAYEDALFDIAALGIFVPDENGGYREDSPLTRAEFATAILRVIGYNEIISDGAAQKFKDVEKDAWYYNSIQAISQLEIMAGDGNGYFRPQNHVTMREAVKTAVVILGYGNEAEKQGGWPDGYLALGTKLRLLEGMKSGDIFTRGDLAVLLHNAIDTEVLSKRYGKEEYFRDGNTYRYMLMNIHGERIFNVEGIVTATPYSYTVFPIDDLQDNEVVIDNIRYNMGYTNADEYLGMHVEVYAQETQEGIMRILSIRPTNHNEVVTVDFTDITGCTNSELTYMENGRKTTVKFEDVPVVLYNGMPIDFDREELLCDCAGQVKFIDCDRNSRAEYIFIEAYENLLVQRVSEKVIVPYNGFTVNGNKTLFVDFEDENKKYKFYDAEGNEITFADIAPQQILSVYADRNNTRYTIYVSDAKAEGKIAEMGDDSVTVNGQTYGTYSQTVFDAMLGDNAIVYLDYLGKVAYLELPKEQKLYGYVLAADRNYVRSGEVTLLVSKNVSFTADVDAEDKDNVTSTPVLICENESITDYILAPRVKVNGKNWDTSDVIELLQTPQPVKFIVNADGLLREIETLDMYAGSETRKLQYNVYDKTFAGNAFIDGFALDENSHIICIPEVVNSEDDYLVRTRVDISGNTVGYLVQAYDYDEITKKAGLVVITKSMDSELVLSADPTSSPACMVKDVSVVCDDENGDYYKLTLIEGGKEVTYNTIQAKPGNEALADLRKGDLISYYMNDSDLIENVLILHSFEDGDSTYQIQHAVYDYVEYCGIVEDISFDEVNNPNNYLATIVTCNIQGGSVPIYIQQRNKPPVFIYDRSGGEVAISSSLEEVVPGHDKLYILSISGTTPRACVIIRGE